MWKWQEEQIVTTTSNLYLYSTRHHSQHGSEFLKLCKGYDKTINTLQFLTQFKLTRLGICAQSAFERLLDLLLIWLKMTDCVYVFNYNFDKLQPFLPILGSFKG